MTYWAIFDATGALVGQVISDHHPCDAPPGGTPAYKVPRENVVALDRLGDLGIERPQQDGTWKLDLDSYKNRLLGAIDTARGKLVKGDDRKQYAHVRKGAEAERLLALSDSTLTAMSETEFTEGFPWLSTEMLQRSLPVNAANLLNAAGKVREAMIESEALAAKNEALAIVAKEAIRAASTREEADAAADISWKS